MIVQTEQPMTPEQGIEVFQDLKITGSKDALDGFRNHVLLHLRAPWTHAAAREKEVRSSSFDDVLVVRRSATKTIPSAHVFLFRREGLYEVGNIVPIETGELGRRGYNAVLRDFVAKFVQPAAAVWQITVEVTNPIQTLDDWLPLNAANALRAFSGSANKSTGSGHPSDRKRWFAFVIAAHMVDNSKFGTDLLSRWLVEVDDWPDDQAQDLVIEYEFGLGLLDYQQGRYA